MKYLLKIVGGILLVGLVGLVVLTAREVFYTPEVVAPVVAPVTIPNVTATRTATVPVPKHKQVMRNTLLLVVPASSVFISEFDKYPDVSAVELAALSTTLYCEAGGEKLQGIYMVADTIRNRVHSKMFPNTYYGVTTQRKQFSCVRDTINMFRNVLIRNTIDERVYKTMMRVAYDTIKGKLPKMTSNALFYHTNRVNPYWAKRYTLLGVVGHHQFYTTKKL